ncbi:uncharacterized protein LOC134257001 [Saccostrea cucullata]|uniref:uncharacterized protein LOC134257001 n=1 Tax=Saccostrea cuccullata TaxID=36930 RepID=UPI002ED41348
MWSDYKWMWYLMIGGVVSFILLAYFQEMFHVVFWKTSSSCGDKINGQPFYFGSTDVVCMRMIKLRHKRSLDSASLPNRKFWSLNHRWIYYDGWYFELFYKPHTRRAAKSENCQIRREPFPAGYTLLDIDCVRRCAIYYNERFEKRYDPFVQNCHHYANKLAEVLCISKSCPDRCLEDNLSNSTTASL